MYAGTAEPGSLCRFANVADVSAASKWPDWKTAMCDDGRPGTAPVRSHAPNAWGFHDMSGNVSELVWDAYSEALSPSVDPVGATEQTRRVYRGGCWSHGARSARVAHRTYIAPTQKTGGLGLRLARALP